MIRARMLNLLKATPTVTNSDLASTVVVFVGLAEMEPLDLMATATTMTTDATWVVKQPPNIKLAPA